MDLYPAIDIRDGCVVRLRRGDYSLQMTYGDDPAAQARVFADAGAPWIHVVDLDAARTGERVNQAQIAAIVAAVDVPVQVGGGVRDDEAAAAYRDIGVTRIVLGTAALENPELVERLAARQRVAVGLDARDGEVAVRGWEQGSGQSVATVAARFASVGVEAFVVTDIARDGMLSGPDVDGLEQFLAEVEVDVIASGGVAELADLGRLAALEGGGRRLAGAIVGRALYEGAFTVDDAVAALS